MAKQQKNKRNSLTDAQFELLKSKFNDVDANEQFYITMFLNNNCIMSCDSDKPVNCVLDFQKRDGNNYPENIVSYFLMGKKENYLCNGYIENHPDISYHIFTKTYNNGHAIFVNYCNGVVEEWELKEGWSKHKLLSREIA